MPRLPKPDRSEKTIEQYKKRTISLLKKAKKELEIPNYYNLELKQFIGWLCADKNNLAYTSWKQYKSAVISYIELSDAIEDNLKEEVLDLLNEVSPDVYVKKTSNTSGEKLKKFPLKDFIIIVSYIEEQIVLLNSRLETSVISQKMEKYQDKIDVLVGLKYWLHAGILTGLRPVEWVETEYVDEKGRERIVVKNAKNSNGRTHGDTRTIHLNSLTNDEREYIKKQIEFCKYQNEIGEFDKYKIKCGDLLRKIGKKVLNKRKQYPSLYSLRHQFAADAKSSGLSRLEIGALMGHATDDTASISYARKASGHSLCRVKADPVEVLKIKQVYDKKNNLNKAINNRLERERNILEQIKKKGS